MSEIQLPSISTREATGLVAALRQHGWRVTRQREVVCRALLSVAGHPSAYDVHAAVRRLDSRVSLATVYGTLRALVASGAISELGVVGDGATHYETNARPHANFVCQRCGRVEDMFDVEVESLSAAAQRRGHRVRGLHVVVVGACADCQSRLTGNLSLS